MPGKDHSKFSTPPLESIWWRADITNENVRWVRKHLGYNSDAVKEFEVIPQSVGIADAPIREDFRCRVHFR